MSEIGYVVVEFNQASGQPSIDGEDIYPDRDEAEEMADLRHAQAQSHGRRERFAVGTVTIEEDDE